MEGVSRTGNDVSHVITHIKGSLLFVITEKSVTDKKKKLYSLIRHHSEEETFTCLKAIVHPKMKTHHLLTLKLLQTCEFLLFIYDPLIGCT